MKLFIIGGGTLGSVTPLRLLMEKIQETNPAISCVWIGTKNGPERGVIPKDIPYYTLPEAKLARFISLKTLLLPFFIFWGVIRSIFFLVREKPDIILGTGAFVQVPVVWAAVILSRVRRRVRIFIHQLDVYPTLSNRLCSWAADHITVSYAGSVEYFPKRKTTLIGCPVFANAHPDMHDIEAHRFRNEKPLLLVTGGSSGAVQLNRLILESREALAKVFNIVLIAGQKNTTILDAGNDSLHVLLFTKALPWHIEQASLVVTRAGFNNLNEVAYAGKPLIIIPMPHSHQVANAQYFEDRGAGAYYPLQSYRIDERISQDFVDFLKKLWDDTERRKRMAAAGKALIVPDAVDVWMRIVFGKESESEVKIPSGR